MRALIIDDSKTTRMLLGRMIGPLGFEFTEAENGQEALDELAKDKDYQLALIDWNMPVMNGYDFIKAVRRNDELRHLVMIMVTTETGVDNVMRAMAAGANEYIMKPFTEEMIVDKLQMLGLLRK